MDVNKKIIWTVAGLAALGIAAYFGLPYLKKREDSAVQTDAPTLAPSPDEEPTPSRGITATSHDLVEPSRLDVVLKQGSKGDNVKELQQALNARYGATLKVDGNFGRATIIALQRAGLPTTINSSTFNVLTKGAGPSPNKLAYSLAQQVWQKNLTGVLKTLKMIRNAQDYSAVNEEYKNLRSAFGVRKTLVNGVLSAFEDSSDKQKIGLEFSRMGLNYDGNKWSLGGFWDRFASGGIMAKRLAALRQMHKAPQPGKELITHAPTFIRNARGSAARVPAGYSIGREIWRRGPFTAFQTRTGRRFYVLTKNVSYV